MTAFPIAIQRPGGGVAIASSERPTVLLAGRGVWPTPNPAGDRLAISVLEPVGDRVASHIDLYSSEGTYLRLLHQVPPGVLPVIAPRVPHYAHWSPDGSRLCYVVQAPDALGLFVCDPTGLLLANQLVTGAPLFAAWSPDSTRLAVHAGTELHLVTRSEHGESVDLIEPVAVGFRTPCFSADGARLFHASARPPGVVVKSSAGSGGHADEVTTLPGGVALAPGPGGMVSISLTRNPDSGVFDALLLLDPESGHAEQIARGPFIASFWSPGREGFVLVVPSQTGDGRFALHAHDAGGSFVGATEGFYPSPDWRLLLGFFDQYGLSHGPWAPDGSQLVVTGRLAGDGVHAAMGDANQRMLTWRPGLREPLEVGMEADLAFFLATPQ